MIQKHLEILGFKVKDKVTNFTGIASSVHFDLYGCIQVSVNPGVDEKGALRDSHWFDLNRLEKISKEPVMQQPNYIEGYQAEAKQGSAERPKNMKN